MTTQRNTRPTADDATADETARDDGATGAGTDRADGRPAADADGSATDPGEAARARREQEVREALRAMKPWKGRATRQDKVLLACAIGIPAFFLALTPVKPLLIADHPIGLAFLTGSNAAVGAAAAFARIGEIPLWLVVVAGVVGKVKVDWLFWWLGRRWGRGFIDLLAQGERARRFADRAHDLNPWIIRFALTLSYLPGVPAALIHVTAGWTGMRLRTFFLFDALGALLLTAVVTAVGHASGQTGVDVILLVDRYALWLTFAIIFVMAFYPVFRQQRAEKARRRAAAEAAAPAGETA
ncbi:DedA family protein [Nocardiopsis sp. FIRDI 009]|uniref:DedA family protein n=1 Tax=Nocardiopsis sp. FIRDI 009 TaxID=714197 RepID=UPI000E28273A|nr:VTT domain-containing protein [Nocardiopsis sp. FIRDI 009]